MIQLKSNEYTPYFELYIKEVLDMSIIDNLKHVQQESNKLISNLTLQKQLFTYSKGKWTIREIIQHLIDTERIMTFRALHIARKDNSELFGFDESVYIKNSRANERDFFELLEELSSLRKSTINLFNSFNDNELKQKGITNGLAITVNALGYIIAGHHKHHLTVIKDKYLNI